MPEYVEDEFYDYLKNMNLKELKLYAIREGSVVFPRIPIMRLEGPLPIVQLLETTLLVLVNYARYYRILMIACKRIFVYELFF